MKKNEILTRRDALEEVQKHSAWSPGRKDFVSISDYCLGRSGPNLYLRSFGGIDVVSSWLDTSSLRQKPLEDHVT